MFDIKTNKFSNFLSEIEKCELSFINNDKYSLTQLKEINSNDNYIKWVITKNINVFCGYLIGCKTKDCIEIFKLFVCEKYRRNNLGSLLVKHLIDNYPNYDLMLEVNTNNKIAIEFYKSLKFNILSSRKNYYGYNQSAIIMLLKR
jgi:ribosomal-protein-alanine N-acetyltransferase